ncbi:MAG: hypothetical protein IJN55_06960 [Alistipes sp.]|nr:hypothetical protein [Alistipes sp.]
MKTEETIYDNERMENQAVNEAPEQLQEQAAEEVKEEPKKGGVAGKVALGVGAGILIGGLTSFGTTAMIDELTEEAEEMVDEVVPEWAQEAMAVATGVTDEMSFGEAFAAARAEVGPGGAFEWRGGVYGTYTADEWANMTAEEREAYQDNFNWNNRSEADVQPVDGDGEVVEPQPEEPAAEEPAAEEPAAEEPVVEEPVVEEPVVEEPTIEEPVAEVDPEVEILGVVHDEELGTVGAVTVDGEEVLLIDVDTDGTFDALVADANHDGEISDNEIVDITEENLSVADVAAAAGVEDPTYASYEGEPDYVNDADTGYDMV